MKPKGKILSLLLTICLVAGLLPTAAFALDGDKTIMLGTSGIKDPTAEGNTYYTPNSYIYFGVNGSEPIKWRVLDADKANDGTTSGMFLLSEHLLGSTKFHGSSNVWQGSDAQKWCTDFASNSSNFSTAEQSAMQGIVKTDSSETLYSISWNESNLTASDKIFFLSARELADYVGNYDRAPGLTATYVGGSAGVWWLRSPSADITGGAGAVLINGLVFDTLVDDGWAARPAFNLDLNSVLFTSAAVGGNQGAVGADAIFEIGDYAGNEWKLTLLDNSRNFAVTEKTASGKPGDTITLNYSGATTGTSEYISVIIADNSGAQYYGRVAQPDTADGTVKVSLPADISDGTYTLNVFSEQYNGDYKTDYASAFAEVSLTVDTTAPTIDTTGTGTACASGANTISLTSLSGAGAKDIYIVAKDAVGNVSQPLKITIPAYIAPSYGISTSPVTLDFGSKTVDYTQAPAAQTVTLTNTGNQNVTVNLPTSTNYTVTAGEGFANDTATLALNGTAAFTVQPKIGLAIGTYSETLTISDTNQTTEASLTANFTVVPRNSGGSGGGGGHTTTSNPQYAVTVLETENGSIRVSPERAKAGDRVKVTATPQAGYALDSLTVTDADGKTLTLNYMQTNVYTFEMPKGEVEISAVFAPATAQPAQPTLSFIDVQPNHWFYDAVCYVAEHGLMHGMSENTFSPNTPLQREMLAVILWNLVGNPEPKNVATFSDVTSSQYYAKAIAWASENGIVSGYGDTFGVGDSITREQFALMLYRYAQYKGYDTTQGGMAVREFSDYAEISDYAKTALTWAVNIGIMHGMGDGTLAPQGQATRAEAATMLMQFCEQVVK